MAGVGGVGSRERAALDRAIDLVGRDLDEALEVRCVLPGLFEQHEHAMYVSLDERAGFHQGPVDVSLSGEVDDHVDTTTVDTLVSLGDMLRFGDVAMHEAVVWPPFVLGEVLSDAGIRELVEVHDLRGIAILVEEKTNEVRADETGTAGDEVSHSGAHDISG